MVGVPRAGVPALPRGAVRRRDAEAVLEAGADRDLTLVCAPPGFGKTSTLASWVRSRPGPPTAWVRLEPEDADPRRLWSAVLAAVTALPEVPSHSRLRRLAVSRSVIEPDFLTELVEGLAALPTRIRLVLDDVEQLRDPPALRGLEMLVRARAQGVQLVLSGRRDPALPLARWRLEERLVELRGEQLAFTVPETTALLEGLGLRLAPRQVALLHGRTEGWAAGLRLAALRLEGHPDPDRFLADFSGDERPVADYLVDEVLAGLGERERATLRAISVAERVPAALAVELTGDENATGVLDELVRDTGLVRAGGPGDEFRLPELLRSYLVADLGRQDPHRVPHLHRRAALWWAGRDRPAAALAHAEQAGDADLVSDLLVRGAARLLGRGEHAVLERALAAGGGAGPHAPVLASVAAHVHLERRRPREVRAALRRAHRAGPAITGNSTAGHSTAGHSTAGHSTADDDTAVDDTAATVRAATEQLLGGVRLRRRPAPDEDPSSERDPALVALERVGRGAARLRGDDPAAAEDLRAGVVLARRHGLDLLELQGLALLAPALWAVDEVPGAVAVAGEALAAAGAQGRDDSPWAAAARAVVAHAALLRAEPGLALRTVGHLGGPDEVAEPATRWALRAARGGALVDLGDRAAGLLELQTARGEAGDARVPAVVAVTAAVLEHRAALRLGHHTAAAVVAGRLASRHPSRPEVRLVRGWTCSVAGDHREAHEAVAPLLDVDPASVPATVAIEAWLVESRGRLARGDRPAAREALRRALALAAPLDVRRPFAHAGALRPLLVDELVPGAPRRDLVARALGGRGDPPAGTAIALSAREHDVLIRLPSLGSLDDIAGDLDVSINTVKTHVRAIYGKLGVSTRRAAVLEAHEQGLLG